MTEETLTKQTALTPMMKQYLDLKKNYQDTILFFRLGDFYEMFFDDAIEASRLLQITLTSRNKGDHKAPMCGVPYHAADTYISKLTKLGKKVAICEQLSDPNLPGIVERDVIRIITPGTTLDENLLDQKANNYVMAIVEREDEIELAYADITTGEFLCTSVEDEKELRAEIERVNPAEVLVPLNAFDGTLMKKIRNFFEHIYFFPYETGEIVLSAEAFLMAYIQETQKKKLPHIDQAGSYKITDYMPLDEATLKNLELLSTLRENKREGSLLWVLDRTITAMGGRMLKQFITHPLVNLCDINLRLNAVDELRNKRNIFDQLQDELKAILDLERLLGRLSLGRGNPRDMVGLKISLQQIPGIKQLLNVCESELLVNVRDGLDGLPDLVELINKALVEDPPISMNDGGYIAEGYNFELDEFKKITRDGKEFIANLQQKEIARTGISNLKIRYNRVFGYYIEISKSHVDKVPEDYIRRQTLTNGERFITPELKEFETKVLGAEEKIVVLEQKLFNELRDKVIGEITRIKKTARNIALLDVMRSFAAVALDNNYYKPVMTEGHDIEIVGGRHPVVEKMTFASRFVANDVALKQDSERFLLITGPNMGGKSTYLRQVALITLMAQMGSFVPAERANIGIVDRIFTRVGASDNLVRGQSTFMVEMQETAYILANATERSLIILDEIGRGTSTYDGMSIAWAIVEHIHDKIGAKTLFATHYHELISLAERLPHASNFAVAVKENADGVVFLYKILKGGVDRSYGIEVAKLAGLPAETVGRAKQILTDLEEGVLENGIQKELSDTTKKIPDDQMGLFREHGAIRNPITNATIESLEKLDLNSLTPLEALNKLADLKKNLNG